MEGVLNMKSFLTAAQARKMMATNGAEEIVKFILQDVAIRAKQGSYNVKVKTSSSVFSDYDQLTIRQVKILLEKLGYSVVIVHTGNSVWFVVDWRES